MLPVSDIPGVQNRALQCSSSRSGVLFEQEVVLAGRKLIQEEQTVQALLFRINKSLTG